MLQDQQYYYEEVNLLDPATIVDDRPHISPERRAYHERKGLTFPVPDGPKPVVCLDPILHTQQCPECDDPECICHELEQLAFYAEEDEKKRANKRRRSRTLVRATYPVDGSLAPVNQGFRMMR